MGGMVKKIVWALNIWLDGLDFSNKHGGKFKDFWSTYVIQADLPHLHGVNHKLSLLISISGVVMVSIFGRVLFACGIL